jgi:hypothetical protein
MTFVVHAKLSGFIPMFVPPPVSHDCKGMLQTIEQALVAIDCRFLLILFLPRTITELLTRQANSNFC